MRATDFSNLADVVRPVGGADRAKPALIYQGREFSYAELDQKSNDLAQVLSASGVNAGDRVAILSKNNTTLVAALFATSKLGAVFVPLNWRLARVEIGYIIANSEPALLLIERGLELLLPVDVTVPRLMFQDAGTLSIDGVAEISAAVDPAVKTGVTDIALIIYTSGTTGHPKGAMITHHNFIRHCDMDIQAPAWAGVGKDEVILQVLPLFHVGGLEMLLRPLFAGATVVLHRELDIENILHDIHRYRVTMTGLVPTALHMMLKHPKSQEVSFTRKC